MSEEHNEESMTKFVISLFLLVALVFGIFYLAHLYYEATDTKKLEGQVPAVSPIR